ncbi:hypothetical protein WM40_09470 [Robbsia andropogonis]|uniref:DUF883 domain-containing protein n=1 Tax=Robbsia andropogonis TaxID=28092 RepID=A0A0F5K172_9BURK|nr:DUF883 family protein [Robbsia andropogonis]KKB63871.1 hypothetical protein WM40_09470 [Robbsia andropogonis]MCP1116666.1 DUF883 family protein [Robbsia andropogonis]MCP1126655.1 DUF883 family protein [Robbsia andropogonis]
MADTSVKLALGRAKVNEDLRVLAADTQELLRLTASASGEQIDALRARLTEQLRYLRERAREQQEVSVAKCAGAAASADEFVRSSPWQALGMAVAGGIVLGALLTR